MVKIIIEEDDKMVTHLKDIPAGTGFAFSGDYFIKTSYGYEEEDLVFAVGIHDWEIYRFDKEIVVVSYDMELRVKQPTNIENEDYEMIR